MSDRKKQGYRTLESRSIGGWGDWRVEELEGSGIGEQKNWRLVGQIIGGWGIRREQRLRSGGIESRLIGWWGDWRVERLEGE